MLAAETFAVILQTTVQRLHCVWGSASHKQVSFSLSYLPQSRRGCSSFSTLFRRIIFHCFPPCFCPQILVPNCPIHPSPWDPCPSCSWGNPWPAVDILQNWYQDEIGSWDIEGRMISGACIRHHGREERNLVLVASAWTIGPDLLVHQTLTFEPVFLEVVWQMKIRWFEMLHTAQVTMHFQLGSR